jgi:hypothetical protein
MPERLRDGIYRLGRDAVNTSHKGEPYYEGCGVYTAGFGRRDQVIFPCVKGGATRPGYFFPAPMKALGDETRFLFPESMKGLRLGDQVSFFLRR